jgi:hypothetical protein
VGAVLLGATDARWQSHLDDTALATTHAAGSIPDALRLARDVGGAAPHPGTGETRRLWELLATIASADLTVARVVEPHLDALTIRAQAGLNYDGQHTWGVFGAEAPGVAVVASENDGGWLLTGTKPWCSLAGSLDRALITARSGESRRLFEIDLHHEGVSIASGGWVARGLASVRSEQIDLAGVPATPVGDDGWYLTRDGFAWGGMGVAAIWFGGAVALGRTLMATMTGREPDQVGLMLLGEVDVVLHGCRSVLAAAAGDVDAGAGHPGVLAQRVRSTASAAAERVASLVGHALGPAPLALDEEHARRVADLQLYVRQDHAERDLARLGAKLLERGETPW